MAMPDNVIRKIHHVYDYYCTTCNRFLWGDGSIVLPYRCDCGEYSDFDFRAGAYKLVKPAPQPTQKDIRDE